jgi:peroxiredoxin
MIRLLAFVVLPLLAADRQGEAVVGTPLPHLAALDSRNQPYSVSMLLQGGARGVLVHFMTVDCKVCKEELKELDAGKALLDAAGVKVLVVDLGDPAERVDACVRELGVTTFPVIIDRTGSIVDRFALRRPLPGGGSETSVPLSFVVDGKGILVSILRKRVEDYVKTVLAKLGRPE